jgi:hypothetical protein
MIEQTLPPKGPRYTFVDTILGNWVVDISLDGEPIEQVREAHTKEGWVNVYNEEGEIVTKHGKVTVTFGD